MYPLIAKLTAAPGKRDELMTILIDGTRDMPGCFSYTVAKDSADENVVWVTETWDSQASRDASLTLPAVKNSITQAKPLIAGFQKSPQPPQSAVWAYRANRACKTTKPSRVDSGGPCVV